ncbi:hypothetical protein ACF1BQ_033185 [Bradyrhizobium sp. RDT10]
MGQERPLAEVVADWMEAEPEAIAAWQNFADEAGASNTRSSSTGCGRP